MKATVVYDATRQPAPDRRQIVAAIHYETLPAPEDTAAYYYGVLHESGRLVLNEEAVYHLSPTFSVLVVFDDGLVVAAEQGAVEAYVAANR